MAKTERIQRSERNIFTDVRDRRQLLQRLNRDESDDQIRNAVYGLKYEEKGEHADHQS